MLVSVTQVCVISISSCGDCLAYNGLPPLASPEAYNADQQTCSYLPEFACDVSPGSSRYKWRDTIVNSGRSFVLFFITFPFQKHKSMQSITLFAALEMEDQKKEKNRRLLIFIGLVICTSFIA